MCLGSRFKGFWLGAQVIWALFQLQIRAFFLNPRVFSALQPLDFHADKSLGFRVLGLGRVEDLRISGIEGSGLPACLGSKRVGGGFRVSRSRV